MSDHFGTRISYSTIYPLWDDTAQNFSRTTLDRLCTFLQVPLGMLIQFIDTESLPQTGGDRAQATPARRSSVKSAAQNQAYFTTADSCRCGVRLCSREGGRFPLPLLCLSPAPARGAGGAIWFGLAWARGVISSGLRRSLLKRAAPLLMFDQVRSLIAAVESCSTLPKAPAAFLCKTRLCP